MIPVAKNQFNWSYHQPNNPSTTPGVAVTPGSGADGSWAQLASSANIAQDVYGIWLNVNTGNTTGTQRDILIDIGVDPAGSTGYAAVINDILASQASAGVAGGYHYYFPLFIKAGSSVAARARSNSTSTVRVSAIFYGLPSNPGAAAVGQYSETLGASGNAGTSFTPGNSSAEGSWASLGTTAKNCWWWQLCVGIANSATTALMYHCDLGVGDASNKHVIIENQRLYLPGTGEQTGSPLMMGSYEVPAGATLYVRGTCSGTAATGFSATAIGIGG